MKKLRIYADTSVFGGCFDEEFRDESRRLFSMARLGQIEIVISDLLLREIEMAPQEVKELLIEFSRAHDSIVYIALNEESEYLRDCYLNARVVGKSQANDALHVALATVSKADIVTSWNFKHIVHFEKIRGFNAVNLREGYLPIEIRSPKEVV